MSNVYFVTGAQGFIGSWVVKALVERGDMAVVFDRSDDSRRLAAVMKQEALERVRFAIGDITDGAAVRAAIEASGARRVIHLAGLQVPTCKADPVAGALVNVVGTLNIFEAARGVGAERVVYASSAAVFGMSEESAPLDESAACDPTTHYGVFKRANEGNARVYFLDHGLSSVALRPYTVYGVGRRMRFDLTVNEFTRDLWADRHLEVFGELFWRPYVHVRDAARAVATVLAAPDERVAGRVFNAGHSDENYRKLDLVEIITRELGRGDVGYVSRDEDPRDYKVSFERIRSELDFVPEMRVPTGVAETIEALEREQFGDPFDGRYSNI